MDLSDLKEALEGLRDSASSLDKVADYCERNYYQNDDKKLAFGETKDYVTQSLASVAYQVDFLAFNFLKKLQDQSDQLDAMAQDVNYISQAVKIRDEKNARQQIGNLAVNRATSENFKIVAPAKMEKLKKFKRKPIDYTTLDHIGHGRDDRGRRLSVSSSNWRPSADTISNISSISCQSDPMPKLLSYDQLSVTPRKTWNSTMIESKVSTLKRGTINGLFESTSSSLESLKMTPKAYLFDNSATL